MEEFKVGDWIYAEKNKDLDWRISNEFIPIFQIKEISSKYLRPVKGKSNGVHASICRKALPHEIPNNELLIEIW